MQPSFQSCEEETSNQRQKKRSSGQRISPITLSAQHFKEGHSNIEKKLMMSAATILPKLVIPPVPFNSTH
jgi:hypothetical protein